MKCSPVLKAAIDSKTKARLMPVIAQRLQRASQAALEKFDKNIAPHIAELKRSLAFDFKAPLDKVSAAAAKIFCDE